MKPREISCQELVERVTEFLEEHLSPEERKDIDDHLRTCSGCVEYVAQILSTKEILERLPQGAGEAFGQGECAKVFEEWFAKRRLP